MRPYPWGLSNNECIWPQLWEFKQRDMWRPELKKRTLTPEKVVDLLASYGTEVSLEQAKLMLDFLSEFVKLALDQQVQET